MNLLYFRKPGMGKSMKLWSSFKELGNVKLSKVMQQKFRVLQSIKVQSRYQLLRYQLQSCCCELSKVHWGSRERWLPSEIRCRQGSRERCQGQPSKLLPGIKRCESYSMVVSGPKHNKAHYPSVLLKHSIRSQASSEYQHFLVLICILFISTICI